MHVPRVRCKKCEITRQIDTSKIYKPRCSYSRQLEQNIIYNFSTQTILATSTEFDMDWHTVANITKNFLQKKI